MEGPPPQNPSVLDQESAPSQVSFFQFEKKWEKKRCQVRRDAAWFAYVDDMEE